MSDSLRLEEGVLLGPQHHHMPGMECIGSDSGISYADQVERQYSLGQVDDSNSTYPAEILRWCDFAKVK